MSTTQEHGQSFAEAALRLSDKTEEEARRTGDLDRADEQVEALFNPEARTEHSPIHRAVWDGACPLEDFAPPPLPASSPWDRVLEACLEVVRRRRAAGTLHDERGKVHPGLLAELGPAGYWGLLIDPAHGGQGVPFRHYLRFLTRVTTENAMVAGLASIHGCIGAVDPVRAFGTPEQKQRFLPRLASGELLSGFALTEPGAGSDLTALRTTAVPDGDDYLLTGEKLFITNVIPGRAVGLVVMLEGRPAVLVAELPRREDEHFQVVPYGLHAVREAHNNGLRFKGFRVPKANLIRPPVGDGLTVAYHGLNRGRLSLCASAAGTMRVMLANLLPWAEFRVTYGQPIARRELVRRRIARLAALVAGADALASWGAWLLDRGYRGELESIVAKVFGSEALKEAAVELFMRTHGGRSFLAGHFFGDNVCDFLAPCIFEGEGEVLGLAFFKSLVKRHGQTFFEPLGQAARAKGIRRPNPLNPAHAWALRRELSAYARWRVGRLFRGRARLALPGGDGTLAGHARFAAGRLGRLADELSEMMVKHQLHLPDRQCRIAELSQRAQDLVTLLVTALWGRQQEQEAPRAAADLLCQDLRQKLTGERPGDGYFRDVGRLADIILAGGFEALAGVPRQELLMPYESQK
jgi:alkylation response protein AidB-like acyl-CoA dehydrogenase